LEHIVDDLGATQEAEDWAKAQMLTGRTVEALTPELVATGWSEDAAIELLERVRKETRRERGVRTREDVLRDVNQRYRKGMSTGWLAGMPTFSSLVRLMYGIANFLTLKERGTPEDRQSSHREPGAKAGDDAPDSR